jgi:hypothetical protein
MCLLRMMPSAQPGQILNRREPAVREWTDVVDLEAQ